MKKIMMIVAGLTLSMLGMAQQMQTSIKIVSGKARIAVKAVGTTYTGANPSSYAFIVAIPQTATAAGVVLKPPTKLDANAVPATTVLNGAELYTYSEAPGPTAKTYFLVAYYGGTQTFTFTNNIETDILELEWLGPNQNIPVSLMSLPDGNFAAPVAPGQWQHYIEFGGGEVSAPPSTWFYQSGTSTPPTQAIDYSTGIAQVTTSPNINTILPVHLLNFSGYKNGGKNKLLWTTASEENNLGFDVQRSTDGVNYTSVGFVNTQATGGNSSTSLSYTFDDNNPIGKKQYYRLNQKDFDGHNKLSNIVMIKGDMPATLGIGGLFPNPASTKVNVIIDAPAKDKITVQVTDMAGKIVHQQLEYVNTGANTVAVDVAKLAAGSYLVKLICQSSDCEAAVGKFNKQ